MFNLTVLIIGFSGLVAQVLLLRELMVNFYGNELTLGIILSNWLVSEAIGAFLFGKVIDRIKDKIKVFIILQVVFSFMLPVVLYFSKDFKTFLGLPLGEGLGLQAVFIVSFIVIFPVSFCHGGLFSCGSKIQSVFFKNISPIGRFYFLELVGTIIGGVVFTYLFIPYLNSFFIVFVILIINIGICFYFLRFTKLKLLKFFVISSFVFCLIFGLRLDSINKSALFNQWKGLKVLESRNSVYGNIVLAAQKEQVTFFYNGLPVITTPFPDKQFIEDFGNLPLLFHEKPLEVLILGSGAGGLVNEIIKYPIKNIDYAELDPLILGMLKKYPTSLTKNEFSDKRLSVKNVDARLYLRETLKQYDVILIGFSGQPDLSTNRVFTEEFFSLLKLRLRPDGIFSFWLPGSLSYLGIELRDINASILNAAKLVFEHVRIVPGDYNIFLASDSVDLLEVSPNLVWQRMNSMNISSAIISLAYLEHRLSKEHVVWFDSQLEKASFEINSDFKPVAVYKTVTLWNRKFSPIFAKALNFLGKMNFRIVFFIALVISLIMILIYKIKKVLKLPICYSIATTGFFGMLMSLVLIFSYQTFYGYLYNRIGLLIAIYMAGAALGGLLITANYKKIKKEFSFFWKLEFSIIVFTLICGFIITKGMYLERYSSFIFTILFFLSGLFTGLEFPLAAKMYLGGNDIMVGETAGVLYFWDLLGGCLAGLIGGVVLLPVLGLFNTCLTIALLKISSLFVYSLSRIKVSIA